MSHLHTVQPVVARALEEVFSDYTPYRQAISLDEIAAKARRNPALARMAEAEAREVTRLYAERHEVLCRAVRAQLGGVLEIVPSSSGLHTVGWLRGGHDEARVVEATAQRQVTVSPLARYVIAPRPDDLGPGLVLGFGGVDAAQIERGVGVLAEVFDSLRPTLPSHRRA